MDKVLNFKQGRVPLLISMPHAGVRLTPAVEAGLIPAARNLQDTDWHIPLLYEFAAELGASTLDAEYSRYVIDLNRPSDDKPLYASATTGLYPATLFDGTPLFREGMQPSAAERATYLEHVWTPYHRTLQNELARLKAEFGYALLFDAHSIRSVVPHLFDGKLPDFNLGTFNGESCAVQLETLLEGICARHTDYSHVLNGRFKGGHITRHYGNPAEHIHAVQLELGQCTYMEEAEPFRYRPDLAAPTQGVLKELLEGLLAWGQKHYA
ncbi:MULTISPECIES: N-formylglutamate deformylase [unclassified Pseudomonas]|uniref:N-formylglutamate deformylase n=1 Tax=unclassified Pseudomonas TaxID=196821 RepID=UPI002AC91D45|nr:MULTISPECIES: N-formylglutamate deformylase [unclassified Pseudomonas]MEB0044752.1 N-formylglutamate deformylase [Pseudomonas sp. Dout3]MEB0096281.1 N-formylglutamate deformylase [Pseudomonas sp. DC1.2]WPX59319.1 N-formylglutamate deformylase [Pseudomonas sp. DC1.2]